MEKKDKTTKTNPRDAKAGTKMTSKRVVALIGVILLVLLYLAALIAAIVDRSASGSLFRICLYATIVIPILIWVYTWMYGKLTRKHTFADFDLGGTAQENVSQKEDRPE